MAKQSSSAEKALQKLGEQLTCSVCLGQYTDPKLLQCFHVFCEACLGPLAERGNGAVVECPNCRQETLLPPSGVSGLRGAFLIRQLFDVQETLKKVSSPTRAQCQKCKKRESTCFCRVCKFICEKCRDFHSEWEELSTHEIISLQAVTSSLLVDKVSPTKTEILCHSHPNKVVDLFCETCEEMICRDCIVKLHRNHQYDLTADAFTKHKDELLTALKPTDSQLDSLCTALADLDALRGEVVQQQNTLSDEVKSNMCKVWQVLAERKDTLLSEIDQLAGQKLKVINAHREHLELLASRIRSCRVFVKESLKNSPPEEILGNKKSVMHQIRVVSSQLKQNILETEVEADMNFVPLKKESLLEVCRLRVPRTVSLSREGDSM